MATLTALPGPIHETPEWVERELMRDERELHVLLGILQTKKTRTLGEELAARYSRTRRGIEEILKRHFAADPTAKRVLEHLGHEWGRSKLREATTNVENACQMLGELRIQFTNQRLKDLQQRVQQLSIHR